MGEDAVLVEDKWLDHFYQMNVWVKNPNGVEPIYYLDQNDILSIIPELYKNGNIIYSKVALINFLKIKSLDKQVKHNILMLGKLHNYVSLLLLLLVINIVVAFI
jgi:hypothetical protein